MISTYRPDIAGFLAEFGYCVYLHELVPFLINRAHLVLPSVFNKWFNCISVAKNINCSITLPDYNQNIPKVNIYRYMYKNMQM